jgi:SAM-dependent methyltransferase
MNKHLKELIIFLQFFGINPKALVFNLKGISFYLKDYRNIKKQKEDDSTFYFGKRSPILSERSSEAGVMSKDYFYQDLLVARKIFENNPVKHVDIGSRIDGFVAHVAVYRPVEIIDIRKLDLNVKNICFRQADLMQLPPDMIEYTDSISALHSIEHFGLGRYGDPIDYFGFLKALENIYKMLRPGGKFYFSVPIGRQRIEFNAQRVFSVKYLLELFSKEYKLKSFSYIDDQGIYFEDAALSDEGIRNNFGCNTGCGIFELIKR